jgi:hypothetical protein
MILEIELARWLVHSCSRDLALILLTSKYDYVFIEIVLLEARQLLLSGLSYLLAASAARTVLYAFGMCYLEQAIWNCSTTSLSL